MEGFGGHLSTEGLCMQVQLNVLPLWHGFYTSMGSRDLFMVGELGSGQATLVKTQQTLFNVISEEACATKH